MKTLLVFIALLFAGLAFAADASPRVLTLTGARHPKAQVQSIDPATGTLMFRWLDSAGKPVDSGNSIVRFTPVSPLPKEKPSAQTVYPEISEATLAAAIGKSR